MHYYGHILCAPRQAGQSLSQFAREIFDQLGVGGSESRPNAWQHDAEDQSYLGSAMGSELRITHSNGPDSERFPFLLSLGPQGSFQAADHLAEHAHFLARLLSCQGCTCLVPK